MAGRAQAAASLHQWLESESPSVAVVGPSEEEALAFVAATIQREPELRREALLAHTVIVFTPESFNDLVGSPSSLLLIPLFNNAIAFKRAVAQKHRLIVPLGGPLVNPTQAIPVGRLDPTSAADALMAAGLGRDRSQQLVEQARRNFSAFKREITPFPTAATPPWATTGTASALLPLWDGREVGPKATSQTFRFLLPCQVLMRRPYSRRQGNGLTLPIRQSVARVSSGTSRQSEKVFCCWLHVPHSTIWSD